MRLGIRTQLIGHTLLTALLVGGSTIGYSIYIHRSSVRQALHTRAETMAAALADALVEPIERKDFQLISLQMEIAEHDPDVWAVCARDAAGVEILRKDGGSASSHGDLELDADLVRDIDSGTIIPIEGRDAFVAIQPVRRGEGLPLGFVCLLVTEERALEQMRQETLGQMGILVFLLVLGTTMAIIRSRRFVRPILQMVTATETIKGGGFGARIEVQRHDELGTLAESINAMAEALQRTTVSEDRLAAKQHELQAAHDALVEAKVEAVRANRAKSEFLANMSHEIRTPMTAILGFADVLLEEGDLELAPPLRLDAARTIKKNGAYLLDILNDILDISKIEAGRLEIERMSCSPLQLIAEIESLMRVRADARGLQFATEWEWPIPETVYTDPTRVKQILVNLVGNAIKFTETGSVSLQTRVLQADGKPSKLQFDVVDTGIGMTAEQTGRLFQPFVQADTSTTRKFGGTGLGLTITKRLASMLDGDITIVSTQLGLGTHIRATVAVGVPDGIKMIHSLSPGGESATGPTDDAGSLQLDCRILLAEDSPDNQRLISHVLSKAGAEVTIAENGRIAVDLAEEAVGEGRPFPIILMDMQMPVLDGYQATMELRERGYTGPIIALTAHAMAGAREKCINSGCNDYVSKPIDRRKLIDTIQLHLTRHQPRTLVRAD